MAIRGGRPNEGEGGNVFSRIWRQRRAVLVGAQAPEQQGIWSLEDSLKELGFLAETAGIVPVGRVSQRLKQVNPAHYLGKGKVEELAQLRDSLGYDLVVVDDELAPSQLRNLERELGVPIVDRTALILLIFANRARTKEGQLQVELAQYEYLYSRLAGQWTHLERQTGGLATRGGAGETQLETDRRIVRDRIGELRRRLESVRRHRSQYRKRRARAGLPVVAMVGYTNAGKSTLFNVLTEAGVLAENKLFATLDPTTRRLRLEGGQEVLLSDTVGFIQKLPTSVVAAFRATLEELQEADVLLHVVDITHQQAYEQSRAVSAVLEELGLQDKLIVTALNKVDLAVSTDPVDGKARASEDGSRQTLRDLARVYPHGVMVSARRGWGLNRLLAELSTVLEERWVEMSVGIPYGHDDLVALFHERGAVDEENYRPDGAHLRGRLPRRLAERFRPYVEQGSGGPARAV
ncbi:MAG: GTPase HflX [Chloroflexi bacterium]|nr:GTPase HflX [Chloroflexota bacterium]MCL5108106.1 GTPase HflX [Chloroflexota bacterium]